MGEAKLYTKSGRRYPKAFEGLGGCHLRALSNVCKSAAEETKEKGVDHKNTEGMLGILNKMKKTNKKVNLVC